MPPQCGGVPSEHRLFERQRVGAGGSRADAGDEESADCRREIRDDEGDGRDYTVTGTVTDVACAVGEAPCLTAADHHGYSIDEAEVIYWGLCPSCSTKP